MKKYIITLIILLSFVFLFVDEALGKYSISDTKTAFNIKKLMNDDIKPTININSVNIVDDKYFTFENVKIDYFDNIKVKDAKYWYNEKNENFMGSGENFESGEYFINEGYYKIVVTDLFGNINTSIVILDKTPPNVTVNFYKKGEV